MYSGKEKGRQGALFSKRETLNVSVDVIEGSRHGDRVLSNYGFPGFFSSFDQADRSQLLVEKSGHGWPVSDLGDQ